MFKLEIYNANTHEMIREKWYKKADLIEWFLDSSLTGKECVLFDDQMRTLKGFYVKHEILDEGTSTIYKVYFKYRLSEVQARIAKLV